MFLCVGIYFVIRKGWVKNCMSFERFFCWRLDVAHLFYIIVLPLVAFVVYYLVTALRASSVFRFFFFPLLRRGLFFFANAFYRHVAIDIYVRTGLTRDTFFRVPRW